MAKSYRLRTKPGVDQNIRININQDFDFLEILSLKLKQEDVYTRFCADYGVVVGRVIANGGYGIPNANVSIFVPLSEIDENDPVISTLYPYKFLDQKNEDGYRYNLLPYVSEYNGHTPTGTFPSREDVLTRKEVLEIYEKYYKYTVKTNESGDFMIIGVPLGSQKIVLDLDLSNMGCFSLRPADLIRTGRGVAEQFNGQRFKSSEDLASLPQIVNAAKDIDVTPFWGQDEICNIGITRSDFDLRDFNIDIKPQATFMGSIFSSSDEDYLRTNCKPKNETGNLCDLVTGPGRILALRQTMNYDVDGRPVLEEYFLENGGSVIDEDGTWLVEVPMNLDYVTTNEFGEQVFSPDPKVGIPTKGKYRFRIKYQNEAGLAAPIQRADFLVPNIKEWGWTAATENLNDDPPLDTDVQLKNYAFSLDWNDYGDTGTTMGLAMIQDAIDCKDRFYEFNYNKVYTVASFIDRWKWGYGRARHLGIKEITDRSCISSTNKFPVNDGVRNFDFIFFLFNLFISISAFIIYPLLVILHVLALLYPIIAFIVNLLIWLINVIVYGICLVVAFLSAKQKKEDCKKTTIKPLSDDNPFKRISFPMISYPDCEACTCEASNLTTDGGEFAQQAESTISSVNSSLLSDINSVASFNRDFSGPVQGLGYNNDLYNIGANQLFSGYQRQGTSAGRDKLVKLPILEAPEVDGGDLFLGADVTLSQSLNLMNQRSRYFDPNVGPNRIRTTVKNINPTTEVVEPSDPFEDNILIILCDAGTLSNLAPGQIISFNNPQNINDPNITGLTVANQFNTNAITGTSPYNPTQLVTVPVTSINPNWSLSTKNLKLKITEQGKDYKFKAGIEYFQVLTGDTYLRFSGLCSPTVSSTPNGPRWDSILNEYIFKKIQSVSYSPGNFPGGGPSLPDTRINVYSTAYLEGRDDYEIIFLVRGVDPYTEKQTIEYDLSKIFGYNYGSGPVISGDYYLNIPIQDNSGSGNWYNNVLTPETHDVANNANTKLYHQPYGFQIDLTLFSAFTNNSPHYYNSTDKSRVSHVAYPGDIYTLGGITNQGITTNNNKIWFQVNYVPPVGSGYDIYKQQGLIEGCSVQASGPIIPDLTNNPGINTISGLFARTYSPAYHLETLSNPNITMIANNRLVFRSDRLPTSDVTEVYGNTSFSLHLNDKFAFYLIDAAGGFTTPALANNATDTTGNAQNLADDESPFTDVVDSLSCENMVPLGCYEGSGLGFGVNPDCDANKMGKDDENQRVIGGCYYFVDNPLVLSLPKDVKAFEEWKSRFRFQFAACRGIISHVFQNNWVNGSLYMFSFKNAKRFNKFGELKKYKYCGDVLSRRPNQGPIIFTTGTTNSFFYRSTPYYYQTDKFIGQYPKQKLLTNDEEWESADKYGGVNTQNIFFPTTVMDLGPRDEFTKEICFNPQFEGYLVDSLRTTSFDDGGDVLQLFILSRLINSNFWGQALGLGDASINKIFSRTEGRVDGDFAQAISINSEYGVEGFSGDDYDQNDIYIENNGGDALFGIFFSSDTANRKLMSPGKTSYTTFGYPKTQIVPVYKWKSQSQTTIFGNDKNEWVTGGPFYSQPYQSMDFNQTDYFKPTNGEKLGYIYNRDSSLNVTPNWPSGQNSYYVVGAPYHFYFGLGKGKSAINRYITKFIFNQ